jgi:hypothetical protein
MSISASAAMQRTAGEKKQSPSPPPEQAAAAAAPALPSIDVSLDAFDEELLNGDREASAALKACHDSHSGCSSGETASTVRSLLLCVRLCVCAHCCSVCSYAQAALKKKTEQAGRWKKLYDEAQEEANRKKEEWAAAEVKAYRLVRLPVCVCYSSMLPLAAHTRAC